MITLNGQTTEFGGSVADLVASRHGSASGIAVAVNGEVLPRSDWPVRVLAEGDRLEIVTAVQGG